MESVVDSRQTSDNAGDSGPKPFRWPVSRRLLRFRYFQQGVPESSIRDILRYGERRFLLKRDLVHVDAADQIAMAGKSTSIQDPVTACRFVLMAAFQTVGTRSPFRPAEAQNACQCTFVAEVLYVLAVLPLGHLLIVFSAARLGWFEEDDLVAEAEREQAWRSRRPRRHITCFLCVEWYSICWKLPMAAIPGLALIFERMVECFASPPRDRQAAHRVKTHNLRRRCPGRARCRSVDERKRALRGE
jgi:hypothetical protein